jgi:glutamyl-tRNA synthetase
MSDILPIVRFAPSPTGHIHLGNARTALLNWCYAKARNGIFILRFDDTDKERSRREFSDGIARDLAWLGIIPDRVERQSDRDAVYSAIAAKLIENRMLYPCYETEDELDKKRRLARASHRPPIYDRAALKLKPEERQKLENEGRKPHWRFKLDGETVAWEDGVRGHQTVETSSLSDPVMIREDGTPLYTFTSVIDDADMGITHIIRGEDHVTNTAVQAQLFRAIGAQPPVFAHHNLLTTAAGAGLSKREGSMSLASLREAGFEAMAVASLATLVGSSEAVHAVKSLDELVKNVDLARLSRAPARVDEEELTALNARLVHEMNYHDAKARLEAMEVGGGEAFWTAIRGNIDFVLEAGEWWRVATTHFPMDRPDVLDEAAFFKSAVQALPTEPWDTTTWKAWTAELSAQTGRKGKALFHPLRLALTGREKGPELATFLPYIGYDRAVDRLKLLSANDGHIL